MCTGEPLFLHNLDDELDHNQKLLLSLWSDEIKEPKLKKIGNPYCRNLIDQILSKNISRRPSCDYILSHPFFVGWKSSTLIGRFPGMPTKYDICLVYRRHGKRNLWKHTAEDDEADWRTVKPSSNNQSNIPNDDEIVDRFRENLENAGLKVCDCYNDDDDAKFKEGDGLNMVHSSMVIVILSRYSINNEELSFDNLVPHSRYDHMLFQLHLALELKEGHMFNKSISITV
jgi:serine/threonine protein kinase